MSFEDSDKEWLFLFCDACEKGSAAPAGDVLADMHLSVNPDIPEKYAETAILVLHPRDQGRTCAFVFSDETDDQWSRAESGFVALAKILPDPTLTKMQYLVSKGGRTSSSGRSIAAAGLEVINRIQMQLVQATHHLTTRCEELCLTFTDHFPFYE